MPISQKFFTMLPQRAVRQTMFTGDAFYNASWDYAISPEGKHYFSVCAEWLDDFGRPGLDAMLYEYIPGNGTLQPCVNVNTDLFTYPRTIRPTKIHTCINFMEDGRIIMNIHTTSPSPEHPQWMPEAYYAHPHEGFPGSNLIIFDPKTGKTEDLGIPIRYESIYGAQYDPSARAYYCSGYFRGHGYRIDLDTHAVTDFGQITEFGSYLHHLGADGHIYLSTRSGSLLRYNTTKQLPEFLGVELPTDLRYGPHQKRSRHVMCYAVNDPDGSKFYCTAHNKSNLLYAYSFADNTVSVVGSVVPDEYREVGDYMVFGMDFDSNGVLWYGLTAVGSSVHLISWDLNRDGSPIDHGIIGTPAHNYTCFCEAHIRENVFYAAGACHPWDPPSIVAVDLATVLEDSGKTGIQALDKATYRAKVYAPYYPCGNYLGETNAATGGIASHSAPDVPGGHALSDGVLRAVPKNNQFMMKTQEKYVTKLWKLCGVQASKVLSVSHDLNSKVTAITGNSDAGWLLHRIRKGHLLSTEPLTCPPETVSVSEKYNDVVFAAPAGRSWLAKAACDAPLADGSYLVGTLAGTLAVVQNGNAYNLGMPIEAGKIHALSSSPDKRTVYGVAGDKDGIGIVFSYSMEAGIVSHGMLYFADGCGNEGLGISTEPTSIDFAPDGRSIAIGVSDQLGCVYEYYFEDR